MPAAPILVNPADAIDGEFFDVDLFQDAGFFAANFDYLVVVFHLCSPFMAFVPHRSGCVVV